MKEFVTPTKRIEYKHWVIFKGEKYIREEVLSLKVFAWENEPTKLIDIHTITWRRADEKHYQESGNVEYFSHDSGWSDGEYMCKENSVPEIESQFKETIGKDLIYFEYSK